MSEQKRSFPPNAVHLVRTAQQINVALSQMADQKASILMGATFVVFTITVGQASRGDISPALFVLGTSALISAMLAVYAVLPSVGGRKAGSNLNLLFFGSFSQLTETEFVDQVLDRLSDDETVYRTMLRDIYQNGQVLQHKKYRYLVYAYRAFIVGLLLTVAVTLGDYLIHL